MRSKIEGSAAGAITRAHLERLDALVADVRTRAHAGAVEGLAEFADERLEAERARYERELATAAVPASIEECDA